MVIHQDPGDTYDIGWWQGASLFALTPTSTRPISLSGSLQGPTSLLQQQLPNSSDKEMVIFRYDAGIAISNGSIDLDPPSSTTPVETTRLALSRPDVWTALVIKLFREKERREGRRQKDYCDTFRKSPRAATSQLVELFNHFAGRWYPEKLKDDTRTDSVEFRKKVVFERSRSATRIMLLSPLSRASSAVDTD